MPQTAACLCLAMVAMGEELSVQLAARMADHLLAYGDAAVRRGVPLALALCHISDPAYEVVDTLSRLSHDPHEETAQAAIFAMGLVGAGTNNSRIAGLLRTLATFYKNEPAQLFVTRIAQGLLHMGKGLVTLTPFHADRLLTSQVSLAGLFATALCGLDLAGTLHGKFHYFLYFLAAAMQPRFVSTVTEAGEPVAVEVRVGQAVETVGQAGKPKTLTGFQTHSTPVLLGARDRAEVADEVFVPLTSAVEGIVVLRVDAEAKARKEAAKVKETERAKIVMARGAGGRADLRWE
jgi:26S proteasome regulatory subunit N1